MAEFANNNTKNANIGHISFKLNSDYYPKISLKDVDPRSRSRSANKLAEELRELILEVYCYNLLTPCIEAKEKSSW